MVKTEKKIRYRGAATVEAALVFPLLLVLTFGVIEYGWLFLKAHQITNAARQGARVAIREDATLLEVQTAIDTLMANAGISYDPPDISDINPGVGNTVTVTITVPSQNVAIINIPLLPLPDQLVASITMSKEGP